jgi:hypothetical protein
VEKVPHPNGYPELGLASQSLPMRFRRDANLRSLANRVERWEAEHDNPGFRIFGLPQVSAPLAFELAHVLVSLRERYPKVRLDHLSMTVRYPSEQMLAQATLYPLTFPSLRAVMADGWSAETMDTLRDELYRGLHDELELLRSFRGSTRVDVSGSVELSRYITSRAGQAAMVEFWEQRNASRVRAGRPPRLPETVTTPATLVLVHEFGHLVDAELWAAGAETAEPVYRVLSELLLGVSDPSPQQWRYHLVNYPSELCDGPASGGKARGRATRRALGDQLAASVGAYAVTNREELFAETFALAHCGSEPVRRRLRPFLRALGDAGLRQDRRR